MERQAKKGSKLREVINGLQDALSKGSSLSDGMKQYPDVFDNLFVSMVKAGEESGKISLALRNVAIQLDKSYQLAKKIKGAMMYPAVIFSLMIVIGVLMMIYMVPTLTATFTGLNIQLPLSTRMIMFASDLLKNHIVLILIFTAAHIVTGKQIGRAHV